MRVLSPAAHHRRQQARAQAEFAARFLQGLPAPGTGEQVSSCLGALPPAAFARPCEGVVSWPKILRPRRAKFFVSFGFSLFLFGPGEARCKQSQARPLGPWTVISANAIATLSGVAGTDADLGVDWGGSPESASLLARWPQCHESRFPLAFTACASRAEGAVSRYRSCYHPGLPAVG